MHKELILYGKRDKDGFIVVPCRVLVSDGKIMFKEAV